MKRHIGWTFLILLISFVLWRMWIPNITSFEAPGWDESDRAHDALVAFRALAHFNPFPLLGQLLFFQTWGPLFSVFSQLPLAVFGAHAYSMTFVSFAGLFFASFGAFFFLQKHLGWFAAFTTCLFAFFWLVSAPPFGVYFLLMMLEAWVIVGWVGIAVAGAIADVDLLITASWILFAAKYQYYPIFFMTFAIYFARRKKLASFAKEFLAPTYVKVLTSIAALLVLHVVIMKIAGPVYGQASWNQPRALRNPVLASFIIGAVLLYARRETFYSHFVERAWEEKYIKWFFWPATVLLAFPWPNRWAGIMVTQSYQAEAHSVSEILNTYTTAIVTSLQTPFAAVIMLAILGVCLILGLSIECLGRGKSFDFKSLPFFVSLVFIIQVFVLLFAVKNVQSRFAFAIFFSVPIGLFAYAMSLTRGWIRIFASVAITGILVAIVVGTVYFRPAAFFLGNLTEATNATYFDHTELYPLDQSLGALVKPLYKEKPVRLAIVQKDAEWLWDRPMQIWPIEFELNGGVPIEEPVLFYKEDSDVCAQARADKPDLIVKAAAQWEIVPCAP